MRLINVVRNSFYSLSSFILVAVLGLIVRKFFVLYLQLELLGLEGLFSNIMNMLSLAEMGVSNIISYGLYRELANNNKKEINVLMNIYRFIYMAIGSLVLIIGIVLFIFLPYIVPDNSFPWLYVQVVFILQLLAVVSTYFLAYKRTLLTADQKDYICSKIDMRCNFLKNVFQLIAIIVFENYLLYASMTLIFNVISNIVISKRANADYSYLHNITIGLKELKTRNFFIDIKNFLIHKVAYIVYGGTDAIVVSVILGLYSSGLMANYILVYNGLYQIMYKTLQGIVPSLGNLINTAGGEKLFNVYKTLDLFYYFFGGFFSCIIVFAFQPFISIFFGNEYLLPIEYVYAMAFNVFITVQFENAWNFRSTSGRFEYDRWYMVASAIANLLFSIFLVKTFGIVGVIIGTIIGFLFIAYGRIKYVFKLILHKPIIPYIFEHFYLSILMIFEWFFIAFIIDKINLPNSYVNIVFDCFVALVVFLIIQFVLFYNNNSFNSGLEYIRNLKIIIRNRYIKKEK